MNFKTWWHHNQHQFDSRYEELFVVNVLSQITDLDFSTVRAQYPFKDLDGRQRYCDFVIKEGSIRIAIEVDGYDKTNSGRGMSHDQFVDWQRRQASCRHAIPWSEAKTKNNQRVTVEGVVAEYRYMPRIKGQPTWINLGAKYPDKNRFTLIIWGNKRDAFGSQLSAALTGQTVCATGTVKIREGVPQLVLYSPQNLLLP
ncbi:MAG TPA: hypothetical protein VK049_01860 [Paenalcaligenes sp.]|nr:hypothetical protein [Paenalcaligenes sp.]